MNRLWPGLCSPPVFPPEPAATRLWQGGHHCQRTSCCPGGGLGAPLCSLTYVNPLPWRLIQRFVDENRLILVAEEPEPFIESLLGGSDKIRESLLAICPGRAETEDIVCALEGLQADEVGVERSAQEYETVGGRGYAGVCDDCPSRLYSEP